MTETQTSTTRLRIVQEIQEDTNGAVFRFHEGGHGRLILRDTDYATHLRLARRSQERQHPVGVNFVEGQAITALVRANNDIPMQVWEEAPDHLQVLFQGHDGVFRVKRDHSEFDRLRAMLGEALQQKARVWFIAHKPDFALLDVMPAGWGVADSQPLTAETRSQPLTEEVFSRKQAFGELADRFIERLRSTKLTGATEVTILYQCVDQQGSALPPMQTSITPRTTVRFPGDQTEARVFAAAMHLDSLIGNINSLVRNAPTGYVSFPECPRAAVQIRGFELEIEQPAESGDAQKRKSEGAAT